MGLLEQLVAVGLFVRMVEVVEVHKADPSVVCSALQLSISIVGALLGANQEVELRERLLISMKIILFPIARVEPVQSRIRF
jgi:hypothetical protein